MSSSTIFRCLAIATTLAACDPGPSGCLETTRVLAYTEPVPMSMSAEQLMDTVAGSFTGPLTWHGGNEDIEVEPATGTTDLTISLTYDGTDVLLMEQEPHDLAPNERLACSDRLEIPATLELQTADGAIAGTWSVAATFIPGSSNVLTVSLRPFGPGNTGNFSATLLHPEDWDPGTDELILSLDFRPDGVTGDLMLTASRDVSKMGNVDEGIGLSTRLASWTIPRD